MAAFPVATTAADSEIYALPVDVFRQASDQADLAISITDSKANILFANDAFTRITGYARDEIVGQNESMLSAGNTPPEIYRQMWTALSNGLAWTGRLLNRHKDGTTYLAELTVSPVVDRNGRITHYLGMHRDVTELNRLERVVRNQKQIIESAIDSAPVAIAMLDETGRVLLDNHEYKKLISEIRVEEPAHYLLNEVAPRWRSRLGRDFVSLSFRHREVRFDLTGQRPRWLSVNLSAIDLQSDSAERYFSGNDSAALMMVITDVTPLRAEQERARIAMLRAAVANEERSASIREGLSAALFRLEEPLNMMSSMYAMLSRRDAASAGVLGGAVSSAREHLDMLRRVIPPTSHELVGGVNLNEILRDVLDICTPELLKAGVTVNWQPAATLPAMYGRPMQLRVLFKALVDNATEAMNARGREVRDLTVASERRADRIVVRISDTGPGIPDDERLRVFEPFHTSKQQGSHIGTGLSRAQQVVADHGGIIELVRSAAGGCEAVVEFRIDGNPL